MLSKFIDLLGQRFGHLLVVKRIENYVSKGGNSFVQYLCQCDCGNFKKIVANKLRSGHTKSCGKCDLCTNFVDLTGQKFDKLTVVKLAGYNLTTKGEKDYKWLCKCDCGSFCTILGRSLKTKGNHNCGCYRKEKRILDETMIGQRFGRLEVLSSGNGLVSSSGGFVNTWICKCDCGNITEVRGASLLNGHTRSCGCLCKELLLGSMYESKSEIFVKKILTEMSLSFIKNKTFDDLLGVNGGLLSYDFCVFINNKICLIECNGLQHYEPVTFFGGNDEYNKQLSHDSLKFNYAKINNFPLLILNCSRYDEFEIGSKLKDFLKNI